MTQSVTTSDHLNVSPEKTHQDSEAVLLPPLESRTAKPHARPVLAQTSLFRELLGSVLFIIIALVISEIAIPRSSIDGPSMQPTLWKGQHLLISRIDYLFGEPQHGDIAVFDPIESALDKEEMLIKRVIGVPGDFIEIKDQQVYRNGELLDEPYFVNAPCTVRMCPDNSWLLGGDEYFMMGDNRNHSNDSRVFGPVKRDRIVGKAIFRYLPVNDFGSLH